jgi:hypothetical protein
MLVQTTELERMKALMLADPAGSFVVRHTAGSDFWEEGVPALLVDDLAAPGVFISQLCAELRIFGEPARYPAAMADLFYGRVEREGGWPDALLRQHWEKSGQREIWLAASPVSAWDAGIAAGFVREPGDTLWESHRYYFTGAPRYAGHVKHRCRLGVGQELYELLRSGIDYDPEGTYVRRLLTRYPSFVCEAEDEQGALEPVCWAVQHSDGTMGMIYTPEQHRRQGYALSLAAYMLDYILSREGFAACHIADVNAASQGVVRSLGAQRWEPMISWRRLLWPEAETGD